MRVVPKVLPSLRGSWGLFAAVCVVLTSIGVVGPAAVRHAAAAGAPDPLFAEGGYVRVGGDSHYRKHLAIGPDDEIVVAMASTTVGGNDYPLLRVERLLADGTHDPAFGSNGVVEIELRPGLEGVAVQTIEVLSDGRILALVATEAVAPPQVPNQLVMIDRSGQLDSTFADGGIFTPDYVPGSCVGWKSMQAFAVGSNGTISVQALETCGTGLDNPRHIGLLSDLGELIGTFGSAGWVEFPVSDNFVDPVGVDDLGRPLVRRQIPEQRVVRLSLDGTVDSTFSPVPLGGDPSPGETVLGDNPFFDPADGSIVTTGFGGSVFFYLADGTPDPLRPAFSNDVFTLEWNGYKNLVFAPTGEMFATGFSTEGFGPVLLDRFGEYTADLRYGSGSERPYDFDVDSNGRLYRLDDIDDQGLVVTRSLLTADDGLFPDAGPGWLYDPSLSRPVVADPVNTATAALVMDETDLAAPDGSSMLEWSRSYDSTRPTAGVLGAGWVTLWDARLEDRGAQVVFINEHGAEFAFIRTGHVGFERPDGLLADLSETADGFRLAWYDGNDWDFTADGVLESISDWAGTGTRVERNTAGRIEQLVATTGQEFVLSYESTPAGERVTEVVASDGRRVLYSYNADGALTSVTNPTDTTSYTHDNKGRIVSETDGTGIVAHVTEYDADGRVIRQVLPTGEITEFTYNAEQRSTSVTDLATGDTIIYRFDSHANLESITDPAGNMTTTEWNADVQLIGSIGSATTRPRPMTSAATSRRSLSRLVAPPPIPTMLRTG